MPWLQLCRDLRRRLRRSPAASRRRRCAGSLLSRRARRRAQAQGADGQEPRTSQARKRLHHDRDGTLSECRMANSRNKSRRHAIIAIATAASLAVPILGDSGPASGAERKIIAESRFDVTNAPQQAELVQLVVDFPPGAWTSWHTHGGQAINLGLEGEITLRHAGMEHPYRAGQAWTDSSGQVHAAGNTGSGKARLLTNFLLPPGAPQTTAVQESSFEPTIVYAASFPLAGLAAETQIVQRVVDLDPGSRTEGALAGFTANLVLSGEVTVGPELKSYQAGQAWSAGAGALVGEQNGSAATARIFTTSLLPRETPR